MTDSNIECWPKAYSLYASGNVDAAIDACTSTACASTLECQRFAGWQYYRKQQYKTAIQWFNKAAAQGDAESAFGCGSAHYALGEYDLAIQNYEQAAARGFTRAHHWIGAMYRDGIGVQQNHENAIVHFQLGSAAGYLVAKRALIHLENSSGGLYSRIGNVLKYLALIIHAIHLAKKDPNDERIIDAPNAFKKKSAQR